MLVSITGHELLIWKTTTQLLYNTVEQLKFNIYPANIKVIRLTIRKIGV